MYLTCSVENLAKSPILNWRAVFDCCIQSRMSKTSKSPRKVLLVAHTAAKDALDEYASLYSPKKFTQHQLFAILVLKIFWNTDYRGIVTMLTDLPKLCETIGLKQVPHFTTLHQFFGFNALRQQYVHV